MNSFRSARTLALFTGIFVLVLCFVFSGLASAQTTISTGSIQGTVTDPQGGGIPNAQISITSKDTGQVIKLKSSATGTYNSGALIPGNYVVRVESPNFKSYEMPVTVQVGVTSNGNVRLEIGAPTTTVTVSETAVQVNTEQSTIQGVLDHQQIESLPINGRNFLDIAQLEPGVQIQDGANFDPTKVGYSSISFGGRFGRTARIEVDGVDISDETVGTTTGNIAASSIQEFQVSQSSLDPSTELTSSGSVNVVTRSGSNDYHGDAFYLFRDARVGSAEPGPFQRNQMGIDAGGPFIKNKLFFFGDYERTKQDLLAPIDLSGTDFASLSGGFNAPFRENDLDGRLDYAGPHGLRMFYRFGYFGNLAVVGSGVGFSPFEDKNYTRSHVVGADFGTGSFAHSIRFSYLKFENDLADAVRGSSLPFASLPISVAIGPLTVGPNPLAPQETPQSDHELKYDGSRVWGSQIFRFGVAYNHLQGGGFASFFKNAAQDTTNQGATELAFAATAGFTCPDGRTGVNCILNYPVEFVTIGNGLGFSSELPAFGFPAGGLGPDNRIGLYFADSWKMKSNLTITAGLRYDRDTGRSDSDLNVPVFASTVNALLPGFGNPVHQPNLNFGPNLGIAWDPFSHGTTVIRAGGGIYYENAIWNNILFDRPERLANGQFLNFPSMCNGAATPVTVAFPSGPQTPPAGTCATASGGTIAIGAAAANIAAFQNSFQTASVGQNTPNASYLPSVIAAGSPIGVGAFGPDYRTPRSFQMNAGVQHQFRPGLVLSVDYLRNISTHYLLSIDENHSGDFRFFNLAAAQTAISTTLANCGVTTIDQSIASCPTDPANGTNDGGTYAPRPATMADYAGNGLDSAADLGTGSCSIALGFNCAFPGKNAGLGPAPFLEPIGRSVYNGLDVKLVENMSGPFRGIHHSSLQVAYSLSRFENAGSTDQDFINGSVDNANPLRFFGPSSLDRKHQFSFGGTFELPVHFRLSTIAHFYSPLPLTLTVPNTGNGPGEIFRTDFTGDGTVADVLPGTNIGEFARSVTPSNINKFINNYNSSMANNPTPAGQLLITNNLFTLSQLQSLGGVAPTVPTAPADQVNMDWLRAFDVKLAWSYRIKDKLTVEPNFAAYNVLNFANFDSPSSEMSGSLSGSAGSANGTNYAGQEPQRVGLGTGVFGLGAPRIVEFGLRLQF